MKIGAYHVLCFIFSFAILGSCVPVTEQIETNLCPFAINLPDRYTLLSSSITGIEATYQFILRGNHRPLMREVAAQLEQQGWRIDSSGQAKIANSIKMQFRCNQKDVLHVSLSPVGRSFMYRLKLSLNPM
jgi:hypothetical protein